MSDLEMIVRCTAILYGYAVIFGVVLWGTQNFGRRN